MHEAVDRMLSPVAGYLQAGTMARLGIRNTMQLAQQYNRFRAGRYLRFRQKAYTEQFEELLRENGPPITPPNVMKDGYALDTSLRLPHLDELLAEAEQVISERGGKSSVDARYRAFLRNLLTPGDLERYPSFLNFILSSDVMATVSNYLGFIPRLSDTLPPGVRFAESSKELDAESHLPPRDSQLYHIDPYSTPMAYIIVLLKDVTPRSGPFTFYPESVSQEVARRLGYWRRGHPYRLSDEEVYSVADPEERIELSYPKGTVLFIDPSRCLHYGSRDAVDPRYQMMYGLVSPCRSDFSETLIDSVPFPMSGSESRLRRMVLDKRFID